MAQVGNVYDSYQDHRFDQYQPVDRFYVRSSVFLPSSDIDPRTGLLRNDAHRLGRTQAKRMEANKLDREFEQLDASLKAHASEKGIRVPLRYSVIGIFLLTMMLAIVLLIQQGMLAQRQRMLKNINLRISATQQANTELETQIVVASDSATICYAAARDLGMVPASSMQPIHLMAMDTRPGELVSQITASTGTLQVADMQAIAGD